jgi:hypothetical protein
MAYLLNDTKKLDSLLDLVDRAVLCYGKSDVKLWADLSSLALQVRLQTMPKSAWRDISGAIGLPEYVD